MKHLIAAAAGLALLVAPAISNARDVRSDRCYEWLANHDSRGALTPWGVDQNEYVIGVYVGYGGRLGLADTVLAYMQLRCENNPSDLIDYTARDYAADVVKRRGGR